MKRKVGRGRGGEDDSLSRTEKYTTHSTRQDVETRGIKLAGRVTCGRDAFAPWPAPRGDHAGPPGRGIRPPPPRIRGLQAQTTGARVPRQDRPGTGRVRLRSHGNAPGIHSGGEVPRAPPAGPLGAIQQHIWQQERAFLYVSISVYLYILEGRLLIFLSTDLKYSARPILLIYQKYILRMEV